MLHLRKKKVHTNSIEAYACNCNCERNCNGCCRGDTLHIHEASVLGPSVLNYAQYNYPNA